MIKKIWILWLQGWDSAPDLVRLCLESWEYHNPDWEIHMLDLKNIENYVDIASDISDWGDITPTGFSDVVRLYLLKEHGGVWVDSTCFCNRPLDDWLPEHLNESFAFQLSDVKVASWFIAAEKDSYVIDRWKDATLDYWKERLAGNDVLNDEYRWVHILFLRLYKSDPKFREIYDNWNHINADWMNKNYRANGPHFFAPYERHLNSVADSTVMERVDSKVDPLYKLTNRTPIDWNIPNSSIRYLAKSIDLEINIE